MRLNDDAILKQPKDEIKIVKFNNNDLKVTIGRIFRTIHLSHKKVTKPKVLKILKKDSKLLTF